MIIKLQIIYINSIVAQYNLGVPSSKVLACRAVFCIEGSRIESLEDDDVLPTPYSREVSVLYSLKAP